MDYMLILLGGGIIIGYVLWLITRTDAETKDIEARADYELKRQERLIQTQQRRNYDDVPCVVCDPERIPFMLFGTKDYCHKHYAELEEELKVE